MLLRLLVLLTLLPTLAHAQTYTSILVFGDSLSDAGNVAHLTNAQFGVRIPSPAYGYTDGRFTDGPDTAPAATLYTGVWIEQLAATLPTHPPVTASLDGGTDFAFGAATTGPGTTPLHFGSVLVDVDNLGQQVTRYLTAHPTIPPNTLVVVWAGTNDLLNAVPNTDVSTSVANELAALQRLISAGATDLLVANLPPLGSTPRLTITSNAAAANIASQAFNAGLSSGLATLPAANPGIPLNLHTLDIFSLFTSVLANPSAYSLTNVTGLSQARLTVDPDQYLFWDDLHPTTAAHHLIAVAAAALLTPPASPGISASLTPATVTIPAGSTATSTLTVTPAAGFNGSVAITCGSLPAYSSCNTGSTPPATFSTPQHFTVTITTDGTSLPTPASILTPGTSVPALFAAALSLVLLRSLSRRRHRHPGLLLVSATASFAALLSLAGCGGVTHHTAPGTYTIPLTVTPSTGSPTSATLTLTVQ